ncbi:ester cyclase [Mesorhizobium sp. M0199]|uniref:ester cyclase n=1 Tax=Mesorhizobium sp. M0199 TaxID=2956911 RepID=UPI00333D0D9E
MHPMDRRKFVGGGVAIVTLAMPSSTRAELAEIGSSAVGMKLSREELVARLVRAGEVEVSGAPPEEIASYFDTKKFRFHGPGGFETDYHGLQEYFASVRAAFDDRSIRRGIMVVEGNTVACQTWIEGRFVREFTMSPAGPIGPNGQKVTWNLINLFVFDDNARLIEEFVQTDYRSFLTQLGAEGK